MAPFRYRPFRRLVAARCASSFDKTMAPVVLAFAVLDLNGSPLDLGLVIGARSLALVAFVMVGGVVADRLPRMLVLQGSGVGAGAALALAAASMYGGFASVSLLLWLSLISGAFAGISLPAIMALTPETVPGGLIRQANTASRLGANAALLIGASSAGIVVATLSSATGIVLDAAMCALMAISFTGLGQTSAVPARAGAHPIRDLREGWQEFTGRQWLWVVTVAFALVNAAAAGGLQVLGPVVADDSFGRSVWGFALAAQTGGMLFGGLTAMYWKPARALGATVALSILETCPLLVLAFHPQPVLLMLAMTAAGIAMELFGIAWDVSLQDNVPADRLARIYAYDALGSYVTIPIGQAIAGPLAGRVGTDVTLLLCAGLVVVAIAGALCSRSLRELTRNPGHDKR
ncbi:MFS transporter [Amycolatopsis pithecellobii]|uniref:MFS transporter n=1 Tax=Amycolatopsis pithecellobii TaxID=664692 RepID=UPI001FE7BCA1|nr:MFS transporter [Amycolatopsis pithecellobii]